MIIKNQFKAPFCFVDQILEYELKKRIVCVKAISSNEPCFHNQEDQAPFPNTLLIEALVQSANILLKLDSDFVVSQCRLETIVSCQFLKELMPGAQCRLEVNIQAIKKEQVKFEGFVIVEGQIVTEIKYSFAIETVKPKAQIHPLAYVDKTAVLGKDVQIGPNVFIGESVVIGDRCQIEANAIIEKWTQMGEDNRIRYGAVIGSAPQDVKYSGERSATILGDHNDIREYVTINRATGREEKTIIGSHNLFLTQAHIGHNCIVGDHVVIINMATIGGHCQIQDKAIIGGMTGIHQFSKIGKAAMVGAYTRSTKDVLPFLLCEGNPALVRGLNSVGLRRSKVGRHVMKELKELYKLIFESNLNTKQAIDEIKKRSFSSEQAKELITFLNKPSERGFVKRSATDL